MMTLTKIKDLGRVVTGSTPSTANKDFFGGEWKFIKPSDMEEDKRCVPVTETNLSLLGLEHLGARSIPAHTTCVVCIGTIGKVCLTTETCATNQQINSIVVDKSHHDPLYIYYLLTNSIPYVQVVEGGSASGRQHVKKSVFEQIELPIPSLPIQKKIASVLSSYDDLIENNERRIKILEEMAQSIYQEWFVNYRFPGHENVRMVDSELGEIPEGWKVKQLSELVTTQYGFTESATNSEVGPKFVRGTDINKSSYIEWQNVPFCPISDADHAKYKLAMGDIVIIRMADPGKVGIVEADIDAVFASYLIRLSRKREDLDAYYLFYFLLSDEYQGFVTGASTGTTRKSASASLITNISLCIPPEATQEEFGKRISEFRTMLNKLLQRNQNLRQTRDLLLPKLISGELDVEELDIAVA